MPRPDPLHEETRTRRSAHFRPGLLGSSSGVDFDAAALGNPKAVGDALYLVRDVRKYDREELRSSGRNQTPSILMSSGYGYDWRSAETLHDREKLANLSSIGVCFRLAEAQYVLTTSPTTHFIRGGHNYERHNSDERQS
jgi:hypothetical protein